MTPGQIQTLAAHIATSTDEWAAMRRAIRPALRVLVREVNQTWYIMQPYAIRQQIGIYAKPTSKKIRKMIRALQ